MPQTVLRVALCLGGSRAWQVLGTWHFLLSFTAPCTFALKEHRLTKHRACRIEQTEGRQPHGHTCAGSQPASQATVCLHNRLVSATTLICAGVSATLQPGPPGEAGQQRRGGAAASGPHTRDSAPCHTHTQQNLVAHCSELWQFQGGSPLRGCSYNWWSDASNHPCFRSSQLLIGSCRASS